MKLPLNVQNHTDIVDADGLLIASGNNLENLAMLVNAINMLHSKRDILNAIPRALNYIKDNSEITQEQKRVIRNPDYLALKAYANIIKEISEWSDN
jgi:hypothetical protein